MSRTKASGNAVARGDDHAGLPAAVRSITAQAAGTVNGGAFSTEDVSTIVAALYVTAKTGTITLDVKLQTSDDQGVADAWADVSGGAFAQQTAVGNTVPKTFTGLKAFCRWVFVVAGTTPVVTADVRGYSK